MGKSLMRKIFYVKSKKSGKGEYISALSLKEAKLVGSRRLFAPIDELKVFENKSLTKRVKY